MSDEAASESQPDDKDAETPLPGCIAEIVEAVQELLVAHDRLSDPEDILAAQSWVEWLVDRLADLIDSGCNEDYLRSLEVELCAGDGREISDGTVDIDSGVPHSEIDVAIDRFLADLDRSVDGFDEQHPLRDVCPELHSRRAELRRVVALKWAEDKFHIGLGLPPLRDGENRSAEGPDSDRGPSRGRSMLEG